MPRTRYPTIRAARLAVRVAEPLRAELERAADAEHRKLGDKVRAVLIDWAAQRVIERHQGKEAA
jgi:uncharacterized protein (DUF1778 family)